VDAPDFSLWVVHTPGFIYGFKDNRDYVINDYCSTEEGKENVLVEQGCSDDINTYEKEFICPLGCETDENSIGRCRDVPMNKFQNKITIDGTSLKEGNNPFQILGTTYGNRIYDDRFFGNENWETKQQEIIRDFRNIAISGFNALYLFENECDLNRYKLSSYDDYGDSVIRFKWVLDTAERYGLRVFASCNTDAITGEAGGDGFSSPDVIPYFNPEVQAEAFQTIDEFMNNFENHNAFVGYQTLPHKFSSSEVVNCNNNINCKTSWNFFLEERYGTMENLRSAWGSDALLEDETAIGESGNFKAGWFDYDFGGNKRVAEARKLDWLEFEYKMQGEMFSELSERVSYPYHTEMQTFFETYLGNQHKHEYTTQGWDVQGQENYALSTWKDLGFYKDNQPFDIGNVVSLRKLWSNSDKPYYHTTSYGIQIDSRYHPSITGRQQEQTNDVKEAREYYNTIIPTMLTTDSAGMFLWGYDDSLVNSEIYKTFSLWSYVIKNFDIQTKKDNAQVLILLNRPEFILKGDNNYEASPMRKVQTVANSLMQLGVDYDVKYTSIEDKVISVNELEDYKLVILLSDVEYEHFENGNDFGENLNEYVEQGGTLFMHTTPSSTHKNEHGEVVETPKLNELILNHRSDVGGIGFDTYYWNQGDNTGWNNLIGQGVSVPVVADPPENGDITEREWLSYTELEGNSKVQFLSRLPSGHASLLRIKPFENSDGKVIISEYSLAYLRNIVYDASYTYTEEQLVPCPGD